MTHPAPVDVLEYYRALEQASERMLQAAEADDWDRVAELEGACALLIERLREAGQRAELSPAERAEKHRIMLAILRHDARIRELAEPWLDVWESTPPGSRSVLLH
ncbi:Flagellar protein FliT [Tepidimonas alkaliphilus]|uniref:Flagellar protein FliT n=1 Tax=Tepidimonas alkaliphilus TaxID=2588942 RepID=A0A554W4V2_9BURK|nr:flagellar protein FliT [Tepidimonas alkaliphilus]TSE18601.1 Flagellar protein FliT [Tepidimonas alkaliphilus]